MLVPLNLSLRKKMQPIKMYHDTISQGELRTIALALAKENNKKRIISFGIYP